MRSAADVVELLHQRPLRANAVDRLQQQGEKLLLRKDRWAPTLWVELAEGRVEPIEGLIGKSPQLAQRVRGWNSVFCGDAREEGTGAFPLAAHQLSALGQFFRSRLAFSAAS
jgi:hypothetical protein